MKGIWCIAGIDTGIGKTVATGQLARFLLARGERVLTMKLVQTGCPPGVAEDIRTHRALMGVPLLPEDESGETCPHVLAFPASPLLAAALEGREIDPERVFRTAQSFLERYDVVLLEAAGGLAVPLTPGTTLLDWLVKWSCPVLLVSAPRLGSINHTLLSLEALLRRGIPVGGVLYNLYHTAPPEIIADTRREIGAFLARHGCPGQVIDFGSGTAGDYSPLFSPSGPD